MRRIIRTFTFGAQTLDALDALVAMRPESVEQQELARIAGIVTKQAAATAPQCDVDGLFPKDYEELYARMPKLASKPRLVGEFREPNFLSLRHAINANPLQMMPLIKDVNRRQKLNKRVVKMQLKKSEAPTTKLNASRIADALIVLGLATLKERVTPLGTDAERSKRDDAGEGQDKLPHTR